MLGKYLITNAGMRRSDTYGRFVQVRLWRCSAIQPAERLMRRPSRFSIRRTCFSESPPMLHDGFAILVRAFAAGSFLAHLQSNANSSSVQRRK